MLFVLQFDFVELLDGRRLLTQEARSLEGPQRQSRGVVPPSSHETGFIQYLDSGIWHLAFYNDGKESEVVSFLTTAIGKEPPAPWGLWDLVSLGGRTPGILRIRANKGMCLAHSCQCHLESGMSPSCLGLLDRDGRGNQGNEGREE